jgi:ADP-heptose:LPS heptosyltransferase
VLVTNDSGPAHFATLTPIDVVTLFGPETPRLFAARTPRNAALWAGLTCSPCVSAYNNRQSPCRNNLCMQAISVEQVFAAVCRAYEARRAAAGAAAASNGGTP